MSSLATVRLGATRRVAGAVSGLLRRWWSTPAEAREQTVGLVLSGGGAGAGFQLGALHYLYDVVGIEASVITGTSAGSMLAALLAQGEDHRSQRAMLAQLDRIGQRFRRPADMMVELEWFSELQKLTPTWQRALAARPVRHEPRTITLPALTLAGPRRRAGTERPVAAGTVIRLPRWDPSPVLDTLSMLWNVGRSGTDFDALLRGARQERSMFRPGPVFDWMLDPDVLDPERLARSATELRIAVVGLESGELRYVTGRGELVDREDRPVPGAARVPVADAVRASCAIPAIFPPVALDGEHYVDGGTRENAPVEIAVKHLEVDRCFAIISLPKGLAPESDYADKNIFSIVLRSTAGIMSDEVQVNDLALARAAGAVVIAPEVNLTGLLNVDPGLLAIASDYGWIRAAEACEGATAAEQQLVRELVETRRLCWELENERFAVTLPAPDREVADLADLKLRVRDLVQQIPESRLPRGAGSWWRQWEGHLYDVDEPPFWLT